MKFEVLNRKIELFYSNDEALSTNDEVKKLDLRLLKSKDLRKRLGIEEKRSDIRVLSRKN